MVGFQAVAWRFFYFLLLYFLTLTMFTFFGQFIVFVTPNQASRRAGRAAGRGGVRLRTALASGDGGLCWWHWRQQALISLPSPLHTCPSPGPGPCSCLRCC